MLWLILLLISHVLVIHANKNVPFDFKKFKDLSRLTKNISRDAELERTLKLSAGVYLNKTKSFELHLERTVLITVLGFGNNEGYFHYSVFFYNLLCFIRHHGLDLVVYVLHHGISDVDNQLGTIKSLGVHVVTFPDDIFWELVSRKKYLFQGNHHASYDGNIPSFRSFGSLPMLVPAYEVLLNGYDVIYLDVDIGLVVDPIPYLTQGQASLVLSTETRDCAEYLQNEIPEKINWLSVEPNSGIMLIRKPGLTLFGQWLEKIVERNYHNDQKVFDRSKIPSHFSASCDHTFSLTNFQVGRTNTPSFCLLSEILFQNGKMGVYCPGRQSSRDNWILQMYRFGVVIPQFPEKRFPVTVHVNYVNGKTHELEVRGLWLVEISNGSRPIEWKDMKCKAYDIRKTYYFGIDWANEVKNIELYRNELLEQVRANNTILKGQSNPAVYMIVDNKKRLIPDSETFDAMKLDWNQVRVVPSEVLGKIPLGEPFSHLSED